MAKKRKVGKQKLLEFIYMRPSIDKRFSELQKSFNEISSILNESKK